MDKELPQDERCQAIAKAPAWDFDPRDQRKDQCSRKRFVVGKYGTQYCKQHLFSHSTIHA